MSDTYRTDNPELESLFERYRSAPGSYVFAPLADACRKAGMIEEAIEICEKGVSAHPEYASGYVVRGKCYYDLGNSDQAEASFEKVLELDPNNLVALKYIGLILAERGHASEARGRFEQILALDPDDREISRRLAELPEVDDSTETALREELEEVLGAEEDSARVEPMELREVKDEEFVGGEIILGGDDDTPDVLATTTLADIYAAQGYRGKAVKIYRELLENQPRNADVRRKLRELGESVDEEPPAAPEAGQEAAPEAPVEASDVEPAASDAPAPDAAPTVEQDEAPAVAGSPDTKTSDAKTFDDTASDDKASDANAAYFKRWLQNLNR